MPPPPSDRRYPLVYPPPPTPEQVAAETARKKWRRWKPKGPFPFFQLPAELRARILEHVLLIDGTIDLDPTNHRRIGRRLDMFRTCRQLHNEASELFYSRNTFRLFPTHRAFAKADRHLLQQMGPRYRAQLATLELRLGPGWADPPPCWTLATTPARDRSGLPDCARLRRLRIFVEVDPSHPVFEGWRIDETFYTIFSSELLRRALMLLPESADPVVELDAWPSVQRDGPLVRALLKVARGEGNRIEFGPMRGWRGKEDVDSGDDDGDDDAAKGKGKAPATGVVAGDVAALAQGLATVSLRA